jgi:hypothetical protein
MENNPPPEDEIRRLPLFGSWRNAYLAIGVIFVLQVGFFYLVSHYFE